MNGEITEEEVDQAVRKLKNNKSPGPDGLISEFFKYGLNILKPVITHLFNVIFNTATFPTQWREAIIIPLHKKSEKTDPNNYRGISL